MSYDYSMLFYIKGKFKKRSEIPLASGGSAPEPASLIDFHIFLDFDQIHAKTLKILKSD